MKEPLVEKFITHLLTELRELETELEATQQVLLVTNAKVGNTDINVSYKPHSESELAALVAFGARNPVLVEKMHSKYREALEKIPSLVANGMLSPDDLKVLEELSRRNGPVN